MAVGRAREEAWEFRTAGEESEASEGRDMIPIPQGLEPLTRPAISFLMLPAPPRSPQAHSPPRSIPGNLGAVTAAPLHSNLWTATALELLITIGHQAASELE